MQDFDEAVQHAINRRQGYDLTARAVEMIRKQAITAINVDLVYGLPQQTLESLQRTIAQVLTLQPDRIAVFGYAHLPTRLKHQRLIDDNALPDGLQRFQQAAFIADELERNGYVRIGLDHFARPGDPLAQAKARRNFQGYTTDHTDALIGLGASAIGRLPQGYVQNATTTGDYTRGIRERGLATARGLRLSEQDRVRGHVIERLMCDLEFDGRQLEQEFGAHAKSVVGEARALIDGSEHGLIEPTDTGFRVTSRGRPFLRAICAHFDAYLGTGTARHSIGV